MSTVSLVTKRSDRGFSLVEMLIVVAIVAIMASVALPNIGQYVRNYRIKGAAQEVAGELQTARSRAIMSNTNDGVSFVVADADSYRFVQEDMSGGEEFGPLKDLPQGVRFLVSGTSGSGISLRFNRLGGFCNPGVASCAAAVADPCTADEDAPRCSREGGSAYVGPDAATAGGMVITLLEEGTGLRRTVRIAPGGRVLPQP